jgi:hypothetical protein
MRSEVLTATRMKSVVFRDVAPCRLVNADRRFKAAHCRHHQATILHGVTAQKTPIFILVASNLTQETSTGRALCVKYADFKPLILIALMMEAVNTSETSVNFN